jgi:hypothetical protein
MLGLGLMLVGCSQQVQDPDPVPQPSDSSEIAITLPSSVPRYFGRIPVIQIVARSHTVVFLTSEGEEFSVAFDPATRSREYRSPRFVIRANAEGPGVILYEASLRDGAIVDELEVRHHVDEEGLLVETYTLNGEPTSFIRSALRDALAFEEWSTGTLANTTLSADEFSGAAEMVSFLRSRRTFIATTLLMAKMTGQPDAYDDARELVGSLMEVGGSGGVDDVIETGCGLVATCALFKCVLGGGGLNPACMACSVVGAPCVVKWWVERWPSIQESLNDVLDEFDEWFRNLF